MFFLEKLYLSNFKNYEEKNLVFSPQINCLVGSNGSGKTNLLDAIYFLALSKSAFHNQDGLAINHDAIAMMLEGFFQKQKENTALERTQITCSIQRGQRKVMMHDKKLYERIADHIGNFPVVLLAPDDTDLIKDGSEERRRFFDGVIAQLDGSYLTDYQQYNRLLEQRNSLLKIFFEQHFLDEELLETYTEPFLVLMQKIHQQRVAFMQRFVPIFKKHYTNLSEGREEVEVIYESELADEEFLKEFHRGRQRDVQSQRTNKGIHKDDYIFEISGFSVKKFGSQGQQKSFVMALKLAQFELLEEVKGIKPILLLDDIFDKLDDKRIGKLIESIDNQVFGQVFITDARPERTAKILGKSKVEIMTILITDKT